MIERVARMNSSEWTGLRQALLSLFPASGTPAEVERGQIPQPATPQAASERPRDSLTGDKLLQFGQVTHRAEVRQSLSSPQLRPFDCVPREAIQWTDGSTLGAPVAGRLAIDDAIKAGEGFPMMIEALEDMD